MNHRRLSLAVMAFLALLLAACGQPTTGASDAPAGTTTPSGEDFSPAALEDDPLLRDAATYASEYGLDLDEAVRRLELQDPIGELNAELAAKEQDTFAGLWLEHTPEFRVIVLFTRDGEKTLQSYVEDGPLADIVEVRGAGASLAELRAAHETVMSALGELDIEVHSGLNVTENRVEVFVADTASFAEVLQEANIQLPDHVELVAVGGTSSREIDVCATPSVPGVAFPRQGPVEGMRVMMEAELIGELTLVDGCLRIRSRLGDESLLPVWPPEFTLRAKDDELQILDGNGQVVARVGEEVYMGGGEGSATTMADCVRQQLPAACTGPYWIVGDGVRPNLRRDSDLFSLDVISTTERSVFLLHKKPVLDEWAGEDVPLAGKLVLWDYDRCPRVVSDSGLVDYLPLWPPDYGVRVEDGEVQIVDGSGQVVARVGEEVRLGGGAIPHTWDSEEYRTLYYELPGDCHGPYWIVGE